jgi:Arc/MetJ family transcription regulator
MIEWYEESMRTTISLDDNLGKAARRRARQEGLSLSALVARALRTLLTDRGARTEGEPFRLVTVGGGGPLPGVDLDRTSALVVAEDEASRADELRGR